MKTASAALALTLALAGCTTPILSEGADGRDPRLDASAFADACTEEPGYPAFRASLERVVAARDGEGLRALFHADGAMRVHGVGGRSSAHDWGLGRPEAAAVWPELQEILALGCARSGERLVLPGMAAVSDLEPGQVIVLRDETLRLAPEAHAKAVRAVERGEVFSFDAWDAPKGWTSVLVDGKTGYLPTSALRSAADFRLELAPFEGGWRIASFSDGV